MGPPPKHHILLCLKRPQNRLNLLQKFVRVLKHGSKPGIIKDSLPAIDYFLPFLRQPKILFPAFCHLIKLRASQPQYMLLPIPFGSIGMPVQHIDIDLFHGLRLDDSQICIKHSRCCDKMSYFFLAFLKYTYSKLGTYLHIRTYIEKIGKYSYEIYLFQIFYYATISIFVAKALSTIDSYPIQQILYFFISTLLCLLPVAFKELKDKTP